MGSLEPQLPGAGLAKQMREFLADMRRIERRDWWLWWTAVVVMLLLTFGVVALSFSTVLQVADEDSWFNQFQLKLSVRGLVGLVLLFNTYAIYQHLQIKRLRIELARHAEALSKLEIRAEELFQLAVLDPLTGLYNRRFVDQRLSEEIARARRHGFALTVVLLDLNDFKEINDQYGHLVGDEVLKRFAERLKKAVRFSDLPARVGGDEFLVMLPECRTDQIERMLGRLSGLEVEHNGARIPVTFSAGWAGYKPGEPHEQFLERADQALYADKRAAKNRARSVPAAQ